MTSSADAIRDLREWIARNGWAGYDPYDVRGSVLFLALRRLAGDGPRVRRLPLRVAVELTQAFPLVARRALGVAPAINAHGMALLAAAYWTLGDVDARQAGRECLDWLRANPAPDAGGLSWGYPFDWQSLTRIPRGTPSGFVSVVAGDAFWRAYEAEGSKADLDACARVCEFIVGSLRRTQTSAGVCFSYTTADDLQVHNTNLLTAEFLDRIGRVVERDDWLELAATAASFTLAEQRDDGAIEYWADAQPRRVAGHVDHYHTGNALRSLHRLWQRSADLRYRDARDRLYSYARGVLWAQRNGTTAPLTTPGRLYPIDIHACAESILYNAVLADELPEARALGDGAVKWTLTRMQMDGGRFGHLLVRRYGRDILVGIPYLRWSQAPMLLALSSHLAAAEGA
jgi:hypothetical protein